MPGSMSSCRGCRGHGTTLADMMTTGWADWAGEADAAYGRLAARTDAIVVAGLSMGGSLTCGPPSTTRSARRRRHQPGDPAAGARRDGSLDELPTAAPR